MTTPTYLFKVTTEKPDQTNPKIELSDLDRQSGFIHLSTGTQIPQTCNLFFSAIDTLHILKFPYNKIQDRTKWERAPDRDELFPHVYGELWTEEMDSVRTFHKRERTWMDVLGEEAWLFNAEKEEDDQ
jgi:uncharacterized protein (DUF952 family)